MMTMTRTALTSAVLGAALAFAPSADAVRPAAPGCHVLSVVTETTTDPHVVFSNFPTSVTWRGLVEITTTTTRCHGRTSQTVSMVLLMPAPNA